MLKNILQRIEEENAKEEVWIVGPKTGKMLYWLVRVLQPEYALEIGTSVGYSALWIASALEENGMGQLWTIESHNERFLRAQKNIEEADLGHRIHQIKGHAPEVFIENDEVPEKLDFAFFDATKMEHSLYFDAIFPRMKKGGMIVVDNVLSHRTGQMEGFINRTHAHSGLKVVEVSVGDGLLVARVI